MASVPTWGEGARARVRPRGLTLPWQAVAVLRGLAIFIGAFTTLNLIGERRTPGFAQNVWWIDLRWLPAPLADLVLAVCAVLFVAWGLRPGAGRRRRQVTAAVAAVLAVAAVVDAGRFYRVWRAGDVAPAVPLPLSALIAVALFMIAWGVVASPGPGHDEIGAAGRPGSSAGRSRRTLLRPMLAAAALLVVTLLFPLAQILFFGTTDYRRPADAAVVFGAQVHPGGVPSKTLIWRVDTACDLYRQGLVTWLVMSGGVGESGDDEAQVMRQMALRRGIPDAAIIVDSQGVNTAATVRGTLALARRDAFRRLLAVSNAYHLPRIKLAYARQGVDVLTVPARETSRIKETPCLWLREVPAFWVYYLRAVLR